MKRDAAFYACSLLGTSSYLVRKNTTVEAQ